SVQPETSLRPLILPKNSPMFSAHQGVANETGDLDDPTLAAIGRNDGFGCVGPRSRPDVDTGQAQGWIPGRGEGLDRTTERPHFSAGHCDLSYPHRFAHRKAASTSGPGSQADRLRP